jgi:hypothetical protein
MVLRKSLGFAKGVSALVGARLFLDFLVGEALIEVVDEPDE